MVLISVSAKKSLRVGALLFIPGALLCIFAALRKLPEFDPVNFFIGFGMAIVGILAWRSGSSSELEEVYDCKDYLLVRSVSGEEDQIRLSSIMNIENSNVDNPNQTTLRLAHPSKFGTSVTFLAREDRTWVPAGSKNPIVEDLIVRCYEARAKTAL